jgi:hypothetical protein
MGGATLPWLTLYAGLHPLRGTTGLYGWIAFGAGALACAAGVAASRSHARWLGAWLRRGRLLLGGGVLAFAVWLVFGLVAILHRPAAAMLAPRPGPGLFLVLAGAALILVGPVGEHFLGRGST